jgi:soluble lytic murein transglycosylase
MPKNDIIEHLKSGNAGFIMEADMGEVRELARGNPTAAFYAGLLVRSQERAGVTGSGASSNPEVLSRSLILFQTALGSSAVRVREEAARELLVPALNQEMSPRSLLGELKSLPEESKASKTGTPPEGLGNNPVITLRAAALYVLEEYAGAAGALEEQNSPGSWDKALGIAAELGIQGPGGSQERTSPEKNILRGKVLGFLLAGVPDPAYLWAYRELSRLSPDFLSDSEGAAVLGRIAASKASYTEGMTHFRKVLKQDPSLFFQYPEAAGDLGRCFQYTGAHEEGVSLFLAWDKALQNGAVMDPGLRRGNPRIDVSQIRYRLLYFLGRIERQRKNYAQGGVYFQEALPFAPDEQQEDACIWYILNVSWLNKPEQLVPLLHTFMERWHDPSYFSDLLDPLCRYLVANRRWADMLNLFTRLRFLADGRSAAKYAYILGRALGEGYIPVIDAAVALYTPGMDGLCSEEERKDFLARTFFRIAFEEENASFYYRALSASYLGDQRLLIPDEEAEESEQTGGTAPHPEEMALLLGFFECGAELYSLPYIRDARDGLSTPELRVIAEALSDCGQWIEAIRLVSAYMSREDYRVTRGDMRLSYPRAFKDIIEENADAEGLPRVILYGLIRTESHFDPGIISYAGEIGLSQLMPATAKEEAERLRKKGGPDYRNNLDLQNPVINVRIGSSYLKYLFDVMKSPMQALLSYNGGYNRVRRWRTAESAFPEDLFLETITITETREYGKLVLGAAAAYGYLYFDLTMEGVATKVFRRSNLLL